MIDIDKLNKEEHYNIPDGYFEQLPGQIMGAIRKEKSKKRNIWISSVAAVAAIIICSTIVLNYEKDDTGVKGSDIVIAETSSEQLLEEQMADYYSTELAQMDYYNY